MGGKGQVVGKGVLQDRGRRERSYDRKIGVISRMNVMIFLS